MSQQWACTFDCHYPNGGHSIQCRDANWPLRYWGDGTLHEQKREVQKVPDEEKKPTEFLLTLRVTAVELAELEKHHPVMSVKVYDPRQVTRG